MALMTAIPQDAAAGEFTDIFFGDTPIAMTGIETASQIAFKVS
ncbi:MAG: hypothetical protein ACLTSZ_07635 [Lachnospiraceae bacterium]